MSPATRRLPPYVMSNLPLVSVIIPVWNDRERLATCLRALSGQDYPGDKLEVIVVDNGSQDHPETLGAGFARVQFVLESLPGSYRARNAGVEVARGDVFAFIDADCIPSSSWVTHGVRALRETEGVGLVAGAVEVFPRDKDHPSLAELYDMVLAYPQQSYVQRGHFGGTGNLFTTRGVIASVGAFDGDMNSGGDAEWGQRVFASGRRLVFAADVKVAHPARRTLRELVQKARRVAGGMVQMERRDPARLLWGQWKELVPPPLFLGWIVTSKDIRGPWRRFEVFALLVVLRQVRFWERIRVLLGGAPLR